MSLVKVKRFAQVTIPVDIRRQAHIEQGDFVEISYESKRIILTPKRVSDKNVDWSLKFDEALENLRKPARRAGITTKTIEAAVKSARKKPAF